MQDISKADAIAEGLSRSSYAHAFAKEAGCDWGFDGDTRIGSPVSAYAALWDHINGPGAWDANPWVVAYTFRPENYFLEPRSQNDAGPGARNEAGSVREIRRYLAAGLDAFFTDDPALGRAAVDGR